MQDIALYKVVSGCQLRMYCSKVLGIHCRQNYINIIDFSSSSSYVDWCYRVLEAL